MQYFNSAILPLVEFLQLKHKQTRKLNENVLACIFGCLVLFRRYCHCCQRPDYAHVSLLMEGRAMN